MDEKEELLEEIQATLGFLPGNTGYLLHVLTLPEVIDSTKRYVKAMDKASRCLNYQAPWNCAREAEARYENIKHGWLGAPSGSGVGLAEWWCENCRKKVMEE